MIGTVPPISFMIVMPCSRRGGRRLHSDLGVDWDAKSDVLAGIRGRVAAQATPIVLSNDDVGADPAV